MAFRWYGKQRLREIHRRTAARLDRAARGLRDYIRTMLLAQHYPPAGAPGRYPAYRTGHLARNVEMTMDRHALVARVGTNVEYGRYLELGTRFMSRRPWLSLGAAEFSPALRRIMGGIV